MNPLLKQLLRKPVEQALSKVVGKRINQLDESELVVLQEINEMINELYNERLEEVRSG